MYCVCVLIVLCRLLFVLNVLCLSVVVLFEFSVCDVAGGCYAVSDRLLGVVWLLF